MKVAVTARGKNVESEMDSRFGRCTYFMVYDSDSGDWAIIDNLSESSPEHGAGISAAQRLVDASVSAVITGDCGPKARQVLDQAHIDVHIKQQGSVAEALAAFTAGSLKTGVDPRASETGEK